MIVFLSTVNKKYLSESRSLNLSYLDTNIIHIIVKKKIITLFCSRSKSFLCTDHDSTKIYITSVLHLTNADIFYVNDYCYVVNLDNLIFETDYLITAL